MIDIKENYINLKNELKELLEEAKVDLLNKKEYIEKFKKYKISTFIKINAIHFQNEDTLETTYNRLLEQNKYYYIDKSIFKNDKLNEENFEGHIFLGELREELEEFPLKAYFKTNIKWENLEIFENRNGPFIELKILEDLLNNEISQKEFIELIRQNPLNKLLLINYVI